MKPTPDAAEIVTQLRCASRVRDENYIPLHLSPADCKLAADEIERLRAERIDRTTKKPYEEGVRDVLRRWQQPNYLLLHAGEMTAQEKRTVLAVLKAVALEVDAYLPPRAAEQHGREEGKSALTSRNVTSE